MANIFHGKLVKLRAVELSDLENYFCNGDALDSDDQRNGNRIMKPMSKEIMRQRVESLANANPNDEECFMIITDREGTAVGNINAHSCSKIDGTFQFEIGIRADYRGNGFATEAIRILLRYYFKELGYQKVETRVYEFNNGSQILHEKMGFKLEGRLRRSHFASGAWHTVICYGMTREEFELMHMFPGSF